RIVTPRKPRGTAACRHGPRRACSDDAPALLTNYLVHVSLDQTWSSFANVTRGLKALKMEPGPHIVVVEDEPAQRHLLVDYLARQNFRVTGVSGGADLRKLVARDRPALVLLDVGLPGEDGFAIARWLRESSARVGIIMVTAASDTVDRVIGLEI